LAIGSVCSKKAYSPDLKKHMYLSKEKHLWKQLPHLAHCFPGRFQLVFERSTSCYSKFSRWKRLILLQIHQFSLVGETHVSLEGNPSVLEAQARSTLFLCENWVSFWKKSFLKISSFKVEIGTFCCK
jgi:hypothetical protein